MSLHVSTTGGCHPAYSTVDSVNTSRMSSSSSAATQLSGRSPFLVAMEKVMPKYASWASLNVNAARWRHARDRRNVVNEHLPSDVLMQTGSGCTALNPSSVPVPQLAAAAAGCADGSVSGDMMAPLTNSSSVTVAMSGSVSVCAAKDELRARLTQHSASSSAVHDLSHVGMSDFMTCHHCFVVQLCQLVICTTAVIQLALLPPHEVLQSCLFWCLSLCEQNHVNSSQVIFVRPCSIID